ncbi:IS701 family transposase [Microvirga tunisiensis]|jgi:SRSO17 transposase|uniref:IS701 family transposase n=1 Tax=Microvirga tunisiensis TaxID=2108360 RepID=A0A5N7MX24_9HYPH|nr:IS701 family transposase [Microvirga tunisiensis]MPR13670.1 IS701 family transposase [Microvirga tunisiensis]MPR31513.1 IS701 family transposase [Microvirga tunisiensis]
MSTSVAWEHELQSWLEPFLKPLRHPARRRMCPLYVAGLIGPGDRKSLQPMAARVAPADYDQLHHFVAVGPWDEAPLDAELLAQANQLVGGPDAILVIDDTALLKKGTHSVGVASQYAGVVGKKANCQSLVSLTLAKGEVPVPIVLRLFLPETWIRDPERLKHAGVPETLWVERSKPEIALEELQRMMQAGVSFGAVVTDAGYGISAPFRQGLSALGLLWAVGIPRIQKVYPADVRLGPAPRTRGGPRKTPIPDAEAVASEAMLAKSSWRRITWRRGTKGPLRAKFAAVRVRVADGPAVRLQGRTGQHLPGDEVWLVGEHRTSGERKYYLSNLPPDTSLKQLASLIKARWVCEQAHQQLKEELGLDHFEGRSWRGLHRHALLTLIAYLFLQHLRLRTATGGKKKDRRASTTTDTAGPSAHAA